MVGAEVIGKDLADDFRLNSRSRRAAQSSEVLSLLDGRDSGFASGAPVSELLDSWVIPKDFSLLTFSFGAAHTEVLNAQFGHLALGFCPGISIVNGKRNDLDACVFDAS